MKISAGIYLAIIFGNNKENFLTEYIFDGHIFYKLCQVSSCLSPLGP